MSSLFITANIIMIIINLLAGWRCWRSYRIWTDQAVLLRATASTFEAMLREAYFMRHPAVKSKLYEYYMSIHEDNEEEE